MSDLTATQQRDLHEQAKRYHRDIPHDREACLFCREHETGTCRACLPVESVELVASGYEWSCKMCDKLNHEIEVKLCVKCTECGAEFTVAEWNHATSWA